VLGDWSETIEGTPQAFLVPTYFLNNVYRMTTVTGPDSTRKWRGFHSGLSESDVLH
jgi:hypothetical protein